MHDVPSLAHWMTNAVEVVPRSGLIDAEQLGAPIPSTSTVLEEHELVPPGPTAVRVTACVPDAKVIIAEPEHSMLP